MRIIGCIFLLLISSVLLFGFGGQEEAVDAGTAASLPWKSATVGGVAVEWERVGYEIIFTLTAPTSGWVALGIDPTQKMRDAQFIMAYVTDDGQLVMRDDFGTSPFQHKSDVLLGGMDDIRPIEGFEDENSTTVSFGFPVNSPDPFDVVLEGDMVHTFILAYGPDGADNFTSKHKRLGIVKVQF